MATIGRASEGEMIAGPINNRRPAKLMQMDCCNARAENISPSTSVRTVPIAARTPPIF